MTIFEALKADHETQRTLATQLTNTSGDTARRKAVFDQLKKELAVHADAEERFFYKPLISNDMSQDLSRHGIAEHHEMDELVEDLEETDMSSAGWLVTAKKLEEKIFHHLEDEEQQFFQIAGKVFNNNQKEDLSTKYLAYVKENR
ncbi:hemerythrin [Marivirga lumbricoides]|uniref:Hemerythrin n=1 Tax=Marivirga lumbricoides TaxID=1046115 RepID=A0ABQ1LHF7_9BACT|nr:hemerythrin [Marivirga lumbricoides]